VIEADRRHALQHRLRVNLTAKPYLAEHNENAASRRGVATVATYHVASRRAASMKSMHRCHAGRSSVAGKQQAWDVREGELNFD
jgi:hypothetical protein